jgi:hypothetical protein
MNREELKTAIAEIAAQAGVSANGRSAMAETIVRISEPNRLSLDIFNMFMPVTALQPGDNIQRVVRKGRYPVRQMVPNTMHLTDATYFQDKTQFVFDRLIAGTSCDLWTLNSGDIGTVEQMRTDLRGDVIDSIVAKVFNLLTTVWNSTDTPNNYTDASSGGITSTVLDAMIENVMERASGVRAIVGQRRALLPVYEFAGYEPIVTVVGQSGTALVTPAFEEFYRTNRVSQYKGIPLVELNQVFRNDLPDVNSKMIRTDVVLVVGDQAGEIATMGGFEYQDFTDMRRQPPSYQLHGWQAYGMLVTDPERIGVIKTNT